MTPADAHGRIAAHELYELDGILTMTFTPSKNLALKVEYKSRKNKVVKNEAGDDEDDEEDLSSMTKTTMKLMSQINKKGLEFNPMTGRFSPKGEYSGGKVKCYNSGEEDHIAPKCSKPKKNQDRANGKGKATTNKKKNLKN